jgi:hypothetical protein
MFFNRINQIDGHKITVNLLSNDPHGEFVCFYDDQRDVFYVVETLSILKHFQVYRYKLNNLDFRFIKIISIVRSNLCPIF